MNNEIPTRTIRSLELYRDERIPPGAFLHGVLANDLTAAFGRADTDNLGALGSIVKWLRWELPASAWGTYSAVDDWLTEGKER